MPCWRARMGGMDVIEFLHVPPENTRPHDRKEVTGRHAQLVAWRVYERAWLTESHVSIRPDWANVTRGLFLTTGLLQMR